MGYAEKQIPPWVARPEAVAAAPIPMQQQQADLAGRADLAEQAELEQPAPAEIPAPRTGIPRSPAPASAQLASASAPASAPAPAPATGGQEELQPSGDELVRFIADNPDYSQLTKKQELVSYNGRMYKVVPGPDGPQMREASSQDVPKPPLEADAQISQILFKEMEVKTTAIVRKVAMNPTVLYGHAWVMNNGYFDGDIGDWINYCCRFTLEKGFGVVPTMMTGNPSILSMLKQRDQYGGPPYV